MAKLVKGTFGMFRNPTGALTRILWAMSKEHAEDLLSLASLIHRRLDAATVLSRGAGIDAGLVASRVTMF